MSQLIDDMPSNSSLPSQRVPVTLLTSQVMLSRGPRRTCATVEQWVTTAARLTLSSNSPTK